MSFDPYCRLYLHADINQSELIDRIGSLLGSPAVGCSVKNTLFFLNLKENEDHDKDRFVAEKRFIFARYTSEIEGVDSDVDEEAFIDCVCRLISDLRKSGVMVVAACEFEDSVEERTGWNWTVSSPDHSPIREV